MFNDPAACSTAFFCVWPLAGSHRTATRESLGLLSFSSSSHFAVKSGKSRKTPVMLPPGCARLAIRPLPTGSVSRSSATIGMLRVVDRAASSTAGPLAKITSTFCPIISASIGAIRAGRVAFRNPYDKLDLRGRAITGRAQPIEHCLETHGHQGLRTRVEKTDPRDLGLLRAGSAQKSGQRAAKKDDELPAPHSITSSARARSVGGMVRPNVFAVLRLITSSSGRL